MTESFLLGSLTGSESELLLVNKQFPSVKAGSGLAIPSFQLRKTVETLENVYQRNADTLLLGRNVKARLMQLFKSELKDTDMTCPVGACDLKGSVIRLFANIRIHFSLKDSSASFSEKWPKRNRKMMKLNHV